MHFLSVHWFWINSGGFSYESRHKRTCWNSACRPSSLLSVVGGNHNTQYLSICTQPTQLPKSNKPGNCPWLHPPMQPLPQSPNPEFQLSNTPCLCLLSASKERPCRFLLEYYSHLLINHLLGRLAFIHLLISTGQFSHLS